MKEDIINLLEGVLPPEKVTGERDIAQILDTFSVYEKNIRAFKAYAQAMADEGLLPEGYELKPGATVTTFTDVAGLYRQLCLDFPDMKPWQFQACCKVENGKLEKLISEQYPIGTPKLKSKWKIDQLALDYAAQKQNKPSLNKKK